MTSDLASAMATGVGGGLLLAKNCAIIGLVNVLKPTRPPTNNASNRPTMMNQRTIRIGRARGFSVMALPEILASVTMFMSCTFCSYRLLPRIRRQFAIQVRDDGGFVESNSAENELANLPLEIGSVAVGQAWNRWQSRQRRHQHGVMRKPEQVERIAFDPGCLPCRHGLLQ